MIKNIIFDWSGVINDSVENQLVVVNKIFKSHGGREISLSEMKENWVQPYMLFYNRYLPYLTIEEEQADYRKAMQESPKSKPFSGIVEVLKNFKEEGVKMVILSSDFPETLLSEIDYFGLESIFSDIITNVHDKSESIHKLVEKNNFKREETIFIGDSNHEIEEGKKAGVKTGAVTWGYSPKEKLEALKPDFLINNLEELKLAILPQKNP
jgi:phosphoglycolate phosphatase-like HAD superfamily hydrolase